MYRPNRMLFVFCALLLLFTMSACNTFTPEPAQPTITSDSADAAQSLDPVKTADPQAAIEEIYKEVEIKDLYDATEQDMEDLFSFDLDTISEFYVRYASGRYGVADVYIIKPAEDSEQAMQQMIERLLLIKLTRMTEFENYNIYNAYQIAQNAQVFTRGGYAVLLMLDDVGRAQEIINHYLPQ